MPAWILVFCFILHYIGFTSADGGFADGLFFNENIEPLPITDLVDSTTNLIADADRNSENLSIFDPSLAADFDLFASDDDLNPSVTPILVADCGPAINGFRDKKARLRRQTSCDNPYAGSIPDLSLSTLDQANGGPWRPTTDAEKQRARLMNGLVGVGETTLRTINQIFQNCAPYNKICSSGNEGDIDIEPGSDSSFMVYTLFNGRQSKVFFFLFTSLCMRGSPFNCQYCADLASQSILRVLAFFRKRFIVAKSGSSI